MENEEEFVCKVRFKEGAPDNIEVLEGDEKKCRELFREAKNKITFSEKEENGKA